MTRRLFLRILSAPVAAAALAPVNALGQEARKGKKPDEKPAPKPDEKRRPPPREARTIAGISAWTRASMGQGSQQSR